MPPDAVSPLDAWFAQRGWSAFPFQRQTWAAYHAGRSGLVHAPTGTGKTLAVWLGPVSEWLAEHPQPGREAPPLQVLWLTPLRALAADTSASLDEALRGLGVPWSLQCRTGDTSATIRAAQRKRLPSALVTTPESLTLLLARDDAPSLFTHLRAVIVDEWHELLGSKRGTLVELALARLRQWQPRLRTWGLSATLGNLPIALATLVGTVSTGPEPCLVRGEVPKEIVIDTLLPTVVDRFPWAGHLGLTLVDDVAAAIDAARTALVFTNTRAQSEIWYQALLTARPDWAGLLALHHGSLDRKVRDFVEAGLKDGTLRCVVCTSSLDLGVDFSPVDRVIQIGSPKGVARLLQRAGRSGHQPGEPSRVTCVPTNAFELVEVAAARAAAEAGRIEGREPLPLPLDVLAQHLVTCALGSGFTAGAMLAEVRSAWSYRHISDDEWDWVLDFACRGGEALRAYPEYRRVVRGDDGVYRVLDAAIARRHRMSVGTIVGEAAIQVRYLRGGRLGTVEESFISRLRPGDRFVFAGKVLELVRVRDLTAYVRPAKKAGTVSRWAGGRMPLSTELAAAVRERLHEAAHGRYDGPEMQSVRPILELQARWSRVPDRDELLIEQVKTREGHHLLIYPFEGRFVHEGLAALVAYRLARRRAWTCTIAVNDYGFELLGAEPAPLEGVDWPSLFSPAGLADDIPASLNAAEMARRQFREIARVAGLVFPGFPGSGKTAKQLQMSSSLFYDVFAEYDPDNLLLHQAHREVLERQLEQTRLRTVLERLTAGRTTVMVTHRPTPLAFPLLVELLRGQVSSESLAERVRKMQLVLERAADA